MQLGKKYKQRPPALPSFGKVKISKIHENLEKALDYD